MPVIARTHTHIFRERRVATAEHEDARGLVWKERAKEMCNIFIALKPVERPLRLSSSPRSEAEPKKTK